jgi:tetratricopeptide (TPR) repeat protein
LILINFKLLYYTFSCLEQNFYTVLGISHTATLQEIKLAYKQLALKYHPDRNLGSYTAEEQFKLVNSAYQTLSNPAKRARHDLRLMYQQQRQIVHHQQTYYNYKYQHTRPPASVSERYYYKREQIRRFSKKDLWLTLSLIAGILAFTILLKVVMDHVSSKDNYRTAVAYIADGKYTSAHSLLTDAIHFKPNHAAAYQKRAEIEFNILKNYKAALNDLDQVVNLQKKPSSKVYYMRGISHLQLNDYKQAEHDLSLALELNNKFWDAYLSRGETRLFYLHQPEEAIADLSIYITRKSNGDKVVDALTYRGFAYYKQGEHYLSEKDYIHALNLDKKNGRVHFLLGRTQLELDKPELACQHFAIAYDLGYSAALVELRELCR